VFSSDLFFNQRSEYRGDSEKNKSEENTGVILIKQIRGVNTGEFLKKHHPCVHSSDLFYQNHPCVLL
jgi:purine-nucleoside phosphorylase